MELVSLKILILTLSGVIRIFFGLLPLIIFRGLIRGSEKQARVKKIISYLMFFGGGVLLATCLVHMMPEVRENFEEANLGTKLPVAEIVFIAGFFLIYLLEDLIHGFVHQRRKRKNQRKNDYDLSTSSTSVVGVQNLGYSYNVTPPSTASVSPKQMFGHHMAGKRSEIPGLAPIPRVRSDSNKLNGISTIDAKFTYIDGGYWRDSVTANSQLDLLHSNPNLNARSASLYDIPLSGGTPGLKMNNHYANHEGNKKTNGWEINGHSHEHSHDEDDQHGHSHMHLPSAEEEESMAATFRNMLIVIAMSFHGIFEGMAIGLQKTERDAWLFFLAVSLHECTILFCIGVELISSGTKIVRMITYILVVSLVCPIGIAIAIGISGAPPVVIGSLQALAAGTLLYVTFFEIFAAEGRHLKQKYLHILVAVLGFAFMVFLEFIGGHSHSHGHSHSVHHHDHTEELLATLNNTLINNTTLADDPHHGHDHGHEPTDHRSDPHFHDHDHDGHGHSH